MPKFAANLSFIFQEVEFLDRFAAAAACGFKAVEYLSPYDHPPEVIAEQLTRHGLVQALFNMPPGDWAAGERGIAVLPGREQEFRDGIEQALLYAKATKCRILHAMAGLWPAGRDPADAALSCRPVARRQVEQCLLEPVPVQLLGDDLRRMVIRGEILDCLEATSGRCSKAVEKPDFLEYEAEIGGKFRHGGAPEKAERGHRYSFAAGGSTQYPCR